MIRAIGFDPGMAALGWGIVELGPARQLRHVAHGVIKTRADRTLSKRADTARRCREIGQRLDYLWQWEIPDGPGRIRAAAFEEFRWYGDESDGCGFRAPQAPRRKIASTIQMGNVVGMLREWLRVRDLEPLEPTAQEIKRGIVGSPSASKEQVQRMVGHILGVGAVRPNHAADALGAAVLVALRMGVV